MKIPKLTAGFSLGPATGTYRNGPGGGRAALVPMADISCLSGCVGTGTAYKCSGVCANSPDEESCWQDCTKSSNPGCIHACFQPAAAR